MPKAKNCRLHPEVTCIGNILMSFETFFPTHKLSIEKLLPPLPFNEREITIFGPRLYIVQAKFWGSSLRSKGVYFFSLLTGCQGINSGFLCFSVYSTIHVEPMWTADGWKSWQMAHCGHRLQTWTINQRNRTTSTVIMVEGADSIQL